MNPEVRIKARAAIQQALADIQANEGKKFYWKPYDQANHILTAIRASGLQIVKARAK